MENIKVIEGEIFEDARGQISSLNQFHFDGVRRCYLIHHPNISVVRGWHGHQHERKWFYCVKGRFSVALVRIDDWDRPSQTLVPEIYTLREDDSRMICVPEGYANCLKAHDSGSVMLVLSDKTLEEAAGDSWRYDRDMWVDWSEIEKELI